MFEDYIKELKKCFCDLKNKKTFYRQIPNILTSFRAIGVLPINILYFTGNILPALLLSTFLFITDFFDGKIARKYNIVSSFGAKLDAICDKIMAFGLMIPLLSSNLILLINLFLELFIGITNIVKEKKGYNTETSYVGKVKTWLLSFTLGLGYLSSLTNISTLFFNIFAVITAFLEVGTLGSYIFSFEKEIDNNENITFENKKEEDDETYVKENDEVKGLEYEKENVYYKDENKPKIKVLKREK